MSAISVNFSTTPVTPEEKDYSCPICLDSKSSWWNPFIIHDGKGGDKHPLHYKCIKDWLIKNLSCPICHATVSKSLHSRVDKITQSFKDGVLELEKLFVFGAASAASIAALEIFGLSAGRSALGSCGFIFLASQVLATALGSYASEKDSNEQSRVGVFCGLLGGAFLSSTGMFENATLFQTYAILNLARAAGLIRPSIGASLGAVTSAALLSSGGSVSETVAAGIGGAMGALVNARKNPVITIISAKAGATVATLANQYMDKAILAGALGAAWATTSSTLMNQWRVLYAYSFAP